MVKVAFNTVELRAEHMAKAASNKAELHTEHVAKTLASKGAELCGEQRCREEFPRIRHQTPCAHTKHNTEHQIEGIWFDQPNFQTMRCQAIMSTFILQLVLRIR